MPSTLGVGSLFAVGDCPMHCRVFSSLLGLLQGFPGGSADKESACNAGDPSLAPGLGRSLGEGDSYPLQYSGMENSMDCVRGVARSWSRLSDFPFHVLVSFSLDDSGTPSVTTRNFPSCCRTSLGGRSRGGGVESPPAENHWPSN
ncbi:unnamed protein product [Rangifer tarandus platyrhynchus]|uniref:Uncharacterized protein n=2 Tax=Rangifer tarandus platyrhynchus TaxID=3082113 RepID=A0AC59YGK5_RANTA|nr:unnamed protein product [Rangifer tarandus platyrhynchus]